jgi:trimethylamine--corrinoid protein Co-methyltransferase
VANDLQKKLQLTAITADDVDAIHQATLRILDEVGITLEHEEARIKFLEAGARPFGSRILIPPELVAWALAQCPKQVSIRGRNGMKITLGDGGLHWHNLGGARDVFDPKSQDIRPAMISDVISAARLLDGLDACTCITPFFTPQDVPGELMSLAMYRHTLPNTVKPVYGPGIQTPEEVFYAVRMAEVIGPAPETTFLAVSPVSPLNFPNHLAAAIIEVAKYGVPFGPLPCPTAGATAPITISGAVAQQNAEVLASIVLAQLAHPGLPIVYCGRLAMMEPRTGASIWGGVELGLASAATVQVAHNYGLPVNVYGFSTNSHTLDIQNGFERSMNAIIPALAGADELSGIGEMQAGVAASYAQMVVDNEIAASVHRLRRGFAVDSDALGVEVIAAVMNSTRNFLGQQHTRKYLRGGEILLTHLAERGGWSEWEKRGRGSMADRAQIDAERIMKERQIAPLDEVQLHALDEIMRAADKELVH